MLGIKDNWVLAGYLLCIASAALCVVWGLLCWNRGEETVKTEDIAWAAKEQKVEDEE